MNSSAPQPRTAGICQVGIRLLLGLVPGMVVASPPLSSNIRMPIGSRPYLAVVGSIPLRIQEAASPPDLNTRPPAGAPPQPAPQVAGSPPAIQPQAEVSRPAEDPAPAGHLPESIPSETGSAPAPTPEGKPEKPAKSILPDDTRPKVRAEDFLPFFQPPGANPNPNDVTVAPTPPAPGIQPPSSATYRQQ